MRTMSFAANAKSVEVLLWKGFYCGHAVYFLDWPAVKTVN
jgi:hypothetical protein